MARDQDRTGQAIRFINTFIVNYSNAYSPNKSYSNIGFLFSLEELGCGK
ncbi:hypothetical protein AAZX31_01G196500 [Glycine max]